MNNYKHKSRLAFLWLLLAACVFSAVSAQCWAGPIGLETIAFTDDSKIDEPCNINADTASNGKWWKGPLESVVDAAVAVGEGTFTSVAGGVVGVVVAGSGLWLAVFMIKFIGGFQAPDLPQAMTEIGGLFFRVLIAIALLKNSGFFFNYFFAPVIEAGAGFVNAGSLIGGNDPQITVANGGLAGAGAALVGMADTVHETIGQISAMGSYTACLSRIHIFSILGKDLPEAGWWDIGVLTMGCAMKVGAWIFMAFFPFFVIDAVFRMGVVAALCPLFIASWVFKSTRKYAGTGFSALLNVAFVFMMLKISALIAINLLADASGTSGHTNVTPEDKTAIVCKNRLFHFEEGNLCEGVDTSGGGILIFALCVVYGILLMHTATGELANKFSGIDFSGDNAIKAAKTVANPVMKKAGTIAKNAIGGAVKGGLNKVGNRIKDRKAARTVDKYNAKVEAAKRTGQEFKPSEREQARYQQARARLTNRGYMEKDGSQTKDFGKLLSRSRRGAYEARGGAITAGSSRLADIQAQDKKMETNSYHYRGENTALGRALSHTHLGRAMGMGELKRETTQDANGVVTTNEYRNGLVGGGLKKQTTVGTDGKQVDKIRKDGSIDRKIKGVDGSETTMHVDQNGQPQRARTTYPDGSHSITTFGTDKQGNRVSTTRTRDKWGRITSTGTATYNDQGQEVKSVTTNFENGKVSSKEYTQSTYDPKTGEGVSHTEKVDAQGKTISETESHRDSNGTVTMSYTDNKADGSLTTTDYQGGRPVHSTTDYMDGSQVEKTIGYDEKGRHSGATWTKRDGNGTVLATGIDRADGSARERSDMDYDSNGDYKGVTTSKFSRIIPNQAISQRYHKKNFKY